MKTSYIKYLAMLAIAGTAGMMTSCDLDLENPNGPTVTGFFTSQDRFVQNIIAIQQEWRSDFDVNVLREQGELRSGIYYITGIDGSALNSLREVENNLDAANSQFSNFAGYYGTINNLNNWIIEAESKTTLFNSEADYNYLCGMAYGMRAYLYFQLYKMYGTVPLRLGNEVFQGVYDSNLLFKPRAEAADVMKQIKSDIQKSVDGFAAGKLNDARITTMGANFWNPAATEMLAGEVYLWSGKVATGNQPLVPSDIAIAKTHFENVVNNYGYAMLDDYAKVFSTKRNSEVIFASYYGYGVATANWYWASLWNANTGQAQGNFWSPTGEDGLTRTPYANRLGRYINAEGEQVNNLFWYQQGSVVNRYQYKNSVYYAYDKNDTRRNVFLPAYLVNADEENLNYIADFDEDTHHLAGVFVYKYRGEIQNNKYVGTNDAIYYRLPLAYMYLAEIANYNGENAEVEKYLNMRRKRALGDNFEGHEYVAGDFRANETAIVQEKTREFIQEGQRWWDIRRLSVSKDCKAEDHLIFHPESNPAFGLDLAGHPLWNEVCSNLINIADAKIDAQSPVLKYDGQAHLVLWPLPAGEVFNDEETGHQMTQTPGY